MVYLKLLQVLADGAQHLLEFTELVIAFLLKSVFLLPAPKLLTSVYLLLILGSVVLLVLLPARLAHGSFRECLSPLPTLAAIT